MQPYRALRALSILCGLSLVGVAAYLNINHAREIERDWLSPICIAIGLLAVGSALAVPVMQAAWRSRQRGFALLVLAGMLSGELFGLQMTAERLLAARYSRVQTTATSNQPWEQAKAALDAAIRSAEHECADTVSRDGKRLSGRGDKCQAAERIVDDKRSILARTPAPRTVSSLASLLRLPGEYVELVPALLFSTALLVLGFVFIGFGFGHRVRSLPTVSEVPSGGGIPEDHPVLRALRREGRAMTNDELARAMGVTKSEATKRRREVAPRLRERRDGRHVRVALH